METTPYHFFALLSRMKLIDRWALMRNTARENLSEHTLDTAILAHALASIRCDILHQPCDPERAAALALFHDAPEILTGDLPTPVKYHNDRVRTAYKTVEDAACAEMLTMLPEELQARYRPFFEKTEADAALWQLVKAADKLSALIKCIEEQKAGNTEFDRAAVTTRQTLDAMALPEVAYFLEHFLPGFSLTLDELKQN